MGYRCHIYTLLLKIPSVTFFENTLKKVHALATVLAFLSLLWSDTALATLFMLRSVSGCWAPRISVRSASV